VIYSSGATGLACCARPERQRARLGLFLSPHYPREKQDGAEWWVPQFNEKKRGRERKKEEMASYRDESSQASWIMEVKRY
jgi:hypothetical protein